MGFNAFITTCLTQTSCLRFRLMESLSRLHLVRYVSCWMETCWFYNPSRHLTTVRLLDASFLFNPMLPIKRAFEHREWVLIENSIPKFVENVFWKHLRSPLASATPNPRKYRMNMLTWSHLKEYILDVTYSFIFLIIVCWMAHSMWYGTSILHYSTSSNIECRYLAFRAGPINLI